MKKKAISDEQLADAFLTNQSNDSFGVLYDRYVHKVYKTCFSLTKDTDTAEDYTQDIFIKVFERLDSFRNRSSFSSWLYAISYHYCLDQLRLGKRMIVESLPDETTGEEGDYWLDTEGSSSIEPRLQALERAVQQLSPKEIDLLKLKYERGLSVQAISEHYQLSESAVKMRLKRTRDKLQQLYIAPAL